MELGSEHLLRSPQKIILLLCLGGAIVATAEAWFLRQPGSMDACYSFVEGRVIAQGQGWVEPFVWNYLDDPYVLPHPAFLYWMPLPALVAAAGLFFGGEGFRQSQIGFWLLVAAFPAFTYWLARRWTASEWIALTAGLFAMFPGFYAVYAGTTDGFYIYAWIGGGILAIIGGLKGYSYYSLVGLGLLCGLAHLTRADGLLFLGLTLMWWMASRQRSLPHKVKGALIILGGYGLVCGAWYVRNWVDWGSLFAPAAGRAIWIQNYNQLFHFPASDLTPQWLFGNGILPLIQARWESFLWNLQTTLFVVGLVFFSPFIGIGMIHWRNHAAVRFGALYYGLLFLVMTIFFPFQGSRGGLFHSSAAMLPLMCICGAAGLDRCIRWAAEKRRWNPEEAVPFLLCGMALIAAASTIAIFYERAGVSGAGGSGNKQSVYRQIGETLQAESGNSAIVMVGNPPCYVAETNRMAIAIPEGSLSAVFSAADRFHAQYILLDQDVPAALIPLYLGNETNDRMISVARFSDGETSQPYYLFRIAAQPVNSHGD